MVVEIRPPPEQARPALRDREPLSVLAPNSLLEEGPVRRWLRERETLIPRKKLLA